MAKLTSIQVQYIQDAVINDGAPVEEIAPMFSVSEATVYYHVRKARQAIAAAAASEFDDTPTVPSIELPESVATKS